MGRHEARTRCTVTSVGFSTRTRSIVATRFEGGDERGSCASVYPRRDGARDRPATADETGM
ncbi:hypothetical protein WG70_18810 [Burkholderia oklahomensis EO147]|nr:hypothetical protein WG70_18810 [Burkholderia oklahomensis EO147]